MPAIDVPGAIGFGDPACGGAYVDPHDGECYDFDDHTGGDDAEWEAAADGTDAVFDGAYGSLGVADVFVLGGCVQGYPGDFMLEAG